MSITTLIISFIAAITVMLGIPLRHLAYVRKVEEEELQRADAVANSIARVQIVGALDWGMKWYETTAKHSFLKLVDRLLGMFERSAGRIAGQTKNARLMVQERFRVIPRESAYWKHIHTWKREHVPVKARILREEEGIDISNHTYFS